MYAIKKRKSTFLAGGHGPGNLPGTLESSVTDSATKARLQGVRRGLYSEKSLLCFLLATQPDTQLKRIKEAGKSELAILNFILHSEKAQNECVSNSFSFFVSFLVFAYL